MERIDVLVVGAGIAGASVAYEVSARQKVVLVEREPQPGYHATGRSAALFVEAYGTATNRILTVASGDFLRTPPPGFARAPLVSPRASVYTGSADRQDQVRQLYEETKEIGAAIRLVGGEEVRRLCPVLRPGICAGAVLDTGSLDIDVHELHQGYLRGARARGAVVRSGAPVSWLQWTGSCWHARAGAHEYAATCVVNAAGAWADEVGALAGARPLGLRPLRRTGITFDVPPEVQARDWPAVFEIAGDWYFKPDAGRVMASPADETPSPPCDAQPEELDVAITVDRIETATTLRIHRLASKWAGLRVFAPDGNPVAGFDGAQPHFLWLCGQGGTGIQSAPALAAAIAALLAGGELPARLRSAGLGAQQLSPGRLQVG